jgi:hypothetical protein
MKGGPIQIPGHIRGGPIHIPGHTKGGQIQTPGHMKGGPIQIPGHTRGGQIHRQIHTLGQTRGGITPRGVSYPINRSHPLSALYIDQVKGTTCGQNQYTKQFFIINFKVLMPKMRMVSKKRNFLDD